MTLISGSKIPRGYLVAAFTCAVLPRAGATQERAADDHTVVFEAGAAGERSVKGGAANFGPALSVEVTPTEEWLEIEFGVQALGTTGRTELASDLVFKKPFRLSSSTEFMIGLGPTVSRTYSGTDLSTNHGIELVLDFMFWRRENTGWYLEPSWSRTAAGSAELSIGLTGGFLFAWH